MLVCVFLMHNCTRDRGCSAHPVFPAPSHFEGNAFHSSGTTCRGIAVSYSFGVCNLKRDYFYPRRPGQAKREPGPIRRGGCCLGKMVDDFPPTIGDGGYGSLLSQGRRVEGVSLSQHPRLFLLCLFDQLLADHHHPPRHDEEHRRGTGDRYGEDRHRQRATSAAVASSSQSLVLLSSRCGRTSRLTRAW